MLQTPEDLKYGLGIDIGGAKVSAALVDSDGHIAEYNGQPFIVKGEYDGLTQNAERALGLCVELGQDVLAAGLAPKESIVACGVGTPGSVDFAAAALTMKAANTPGLQGTSFRGVLGPALSLPVYAENDVNSAAYAEALFGAGKGYDPVFCMALGPGVGGGLVVGGQVYRGAWGNSCEIGHAVIDFRGKPCRCGGKGCLETEFSTEVIREAVVQAASEYPESVFGRYVREGQELTPKHLFMGLEEGDAVAQRLFEHFTDALAAGAGIAYTMFDPEVLVLAGGMAGAGDILLEPLRRKVVCYASVQDGHERIIVPAALGTSATIIGAATIAISEETRAAQSGI